MPSRYALLPILVCLFVAPAPMLAQRKLDDFRFRSGSLKVNRQLESGIDDAKHLQLFHHTILRDQINFGICYEDPKYRRIAATYYHPSGPVGMAFLKFNWFPGTVHTYHADARLAASLIGLGCLGPDHVPFLTAAWSEPPVAIIGMAAGTPAAYARPFQHFDFYEPTKGVIDLNERNADRFFHFIPDARNEAPPSASCTAHRASNCKKTRPRNFYHLMILESCSGEDGEKIFLDLFTKEGIAQCMEHLVDDGVLCVHTSHRFVDLPPVLAAIAQELKLQVRRGHDQAPGNARDGKATLTEVGHFTSEWVMLARHPRVLDAFCKTPADYDKMVARKNVMREKYWETPRPGEQVWTDKGPNLLHGVLAATRFPCAIPRPLWR